MKPSWERIAVIPKRFIKMFFNKIEHFVFSIIRHRIKIAMHSVSFLTRKSLKAGIPNTIGEKIKKAGIFLVILRQ